MKENTILLGTTPLIKALFDQEFPGLPQIPLPSYNVRYSVKIPLWIKLLLDSGRIRKVIAEEHEALKQVVKRHRVDVVISDNRFGLHHAEIKTVFMTHQLQVKAPVFSGMVNRINRRYMLQFQEIWVPDYEEMSGSLSGELSHGKRVHPQIRYIGPQSRLQDLDAGPAEKRYDALVLLSGPEPQRTALENGILDALETSGKTVALVRGTPIPLERPTTAEVFDFPDALTIKRLINASACVISRSGYSTLMDLHACHASRMILIPTPGQTEQEYLAHYWQKAFNATCIRQGSIARTLPGIL